MKIKLKSKLWVRLHCRKVTDADNWTYWTHRRLGGTQVYLCKAVLELAGKVVEAVLADEDELNNPADASYRLVTGGRPFWVPNWFIKEVWDEAEV